MDRRTLIVLSLLGLIASCDEDPIRPPPAPPPEAPAYHILVERAPQAAGPRVWVSIDPNTGAESPFTPGLIHVLHLRPSPDGARLGFLAQTGGGLHLWTAARDGSGQVDLFAGMDADVHGADWSPRGDRLVYSEDSFDGHFDIWTMNADGSGRVNLTPDPLPGVWIEVFPAWSPDGSRIAFTSNRSGINGIWLVQADGSDPRALPGGTPGSFPAWDSSGGRIAYVTTTGGRQFAIAVDRLDGSAPHLFPQAGTVGAPVWTPTGEVLFTANPTGRNHELMQLDPATGAVVNLSNSPSNEVSVAILPRLH